MELPPEPRQAERDDIGIVLEREVELEHVDLNVVETGQKEPVEIGNRHPRAVLRVDGPGHQEPVLGTQNAHFVIDP